MNGALITYLIGFLIFICATGCQKDKPTDSAPPGQVEEYPDNEGWNSTIVSTNKGNVDAIIEYGHMARYSKKEMVYFDEGVKVDFYDPEGNHTSRLTSNGGILNENTNNVEAVGNVVVVSDSGVTLFTERLKWDQESEKILSDVDVMITTAEGDTFNGIGFESDPELTNWSIKQLHGISSRSIDLSTERWKKSKKDSLLVDSHADSLMIADSTNVKRQDTSPQGEALSKEKSELSEP